MKYNHYQHITLLLFAFFIELNNTHCRDHKLILQQPIHLFAARNLGLLIQQKHTNIDPQIIAWLSTPEARNIIHEAVADPTKREIGYQTVRKEVYSGAVIHPDTIVLSSSGKPTLVDTIEALHKSNFAHNFIIDHDGKVYPITKEHEDLQEALTHRPFALGITAATLDGFTQCRDMNSHAITISLVGLDSQPHTEEQTTSLTLLVAWLSELYYIAASNVRIYGAVAYPYSTLHDPIHGRRKISTHIPLQTLAEHGLAIWPQTEDNTPSLINFMAHASEEELTHWTSGGLRKIGFLCPDTTYHQHPDYLAALNKFQQLYHCPQNDDDSYKETLVALNSILRQSELHNDKLKDIWPGPFL